MPLRRSRWAIDILVVCSGNVCRSPFIADLLTNRLPGLTVVSAGTTALVGEFPSEFIVKALADHGSDGASLAPAQRVTAKMIKRSRLIITATRSHRAVVLNLDFGAADRTYTLKELARFLDPPPKTPGFDGAMAQAAMRAATFDDFDRDDDLADPYRQLWPAYERMADEVEDALAVIVPALREESSAD